jgi:hypothetical protein
MFAGIVRIPPAGGTGQLLRSALSTESILLNDIAGNVAYRKGRGGSFPRGEFGRMVAP